VRILSLSNCPLDPCLGSGKTRLARTGGLRERGHIVETWDTGLLLRPVARRLGFRLGLAWSARRALARVDLTSFDLVEFCGAEFWWATRWLAAQDPRPLIVAHTDGLELLANLRLAAAGQKARGRTETWLPFFDLERASAQAFVRADRFAALCRLDVEHVISERLFSPGNAVVIPPGLDAIFLGRPFVRQRENTVVFLGSWTPRKGIAHLIRVMTRFLTAHPEWRFVLIGCSGSSETIRTAFAGDIASRVHVAPRLSVNEVVRHLESAKILFFPSEYEGFGLATAEAMACGCAAVLTPTGLGGDLQADREAKICRFGDEMAMLAAVTDLAANDEKREAVARAGHASVQRFDWRRAIDRLDSTYLAWTRLARR
jgi:glycosyltransferase involved in cell wall biosynthesis